MHLLKFGLAPALLSGICFTTIAQAQSLPTPEPQPTPTPVYSAPLQPLPPSSRSPQLLEADRLLQQARLYGQFPQDALKLVQQALNLYQQAGDSKERGFGGVLCPSVKSWQAKPLQGVARSSYLIHDPKQFSALLELSAIYYRLYEDQQAIAIAQQAILLAQTSKSLDREQSAFEYLSRLYEAQGNRQDSIAARKQAVEVARKRGNPNQILTLRDLGAQYERFEQYPEAIVAYQQSLDALAQSKKARFFHYSHVNTVANPEVDALNGLIKAYAALGQPEKASPLSLRLVKRVQSLALLNPSISSPENSLARLPVLQEAARLNHELGDTSTEALILLHLGLHYANHEQPSIALDSAQRALKLSRQLNDQSLEIVGLQLVGTIQLQLRQFSQAIETYQQLRTIAQVQKEDYLHFIALSRLVEAYKATGQLEKSQQVSKELATISPYPFLSSAIVFPSDWWNSSSDLVGPNLYRPLLPEKKYPQVSPALPPTQLRKPSIEPPPDISPIYAPPNP